MTLPVLLDTADRLTDAIYFGSRLLVSSGVGVGRRIDTGNGLQGGGDFSTNRTHSLGPLTNDWDGGAFNVKALNTINYINAVEGFGADPTGVADSTSQIQAALTSALSQGPGQTVYLPPGHYKTTRPILVPFATRLVGAGRTATYIEKDGNLPSTIGTNTFNGATDDYNVDAVIIVRHEDDLANFNPTIQELSISQSGGTNSAWGIWAFRVAKPDFRNLYIDKCDIGIEIRFAYMGKLSQIEVTNCVNAVKLGESTETNAQSQSTTFHMENIWGHSPVAVTGATCYDFYRVHYSSFSACGADGWNPTTPLGVYRLVDCHGLTFNGCGCEDVTGPVIVATDSELSFDGFFTFAVQGVSAGTFGYIDIDNCHFSMIACHFAQSTGGNPANWFPIQAANASTISFAGSQTGLPSGGAGMAAQPLLLGNSVVILSDPGGPKVIGGPWQLSSAGADLVRDIRFQTLDVDRWFLRANAAVESGSDAGTDFELVARHDDGSVMDSPIVCLRAPGGGFSINRPVANTVGAVLTAASTIQLTDQIHHVGGATPIDTIAPPPGVLAGTFQLIPDDAFTTSGSGNIAALTAVPGKPIAITFDGGTWYPSYT